MRGVSIALIAAFIAACGSAEPAPRAPSGRAPITIPSGELARLRTSGSILVVPDNRDKVEMNDQRFVGIYKLCVDESGHFAHAETLKSTGFSHYDAKILDALRHWEHRPYMRDGVAVPVCTAVTFMYTQTMNR